MSSFLSVDVNKWLTTQLDIRYANSTQNKVEQGGRNGVWGSAMYLPSYHNILPYEQDGIEYPAETSAYFRTLRRTEGDQEDQPAYFGTCHHLSAERTENNR